MKVTARRAHKRSPSSRKNEPEVVSVVWSLPAESRVLRVTFNSGAVLSAIALISRPIFEHRREDARARLRPGGVVFALRNASTNDTSFCAGDSATHAMQRSGIERKEAIFAIDNRRARGLSSEKIFVAVCDRLLTRDRSEDCFTHCAVMDAQSISSRPAIHPLNFTAAVLSSPRSFRRPSRRRFWRSPRARQGSRYARPAERGLRP